MGEPEVVRGATVSGADGTREFLAPVVVSGADLKHTYLDLLEPQDVPRTLRRKVRGYEMALPAGVVFTVINRDLREEGVPVTNYLVGGDGFEAAARAAQAGRFPQRPFVWITSATLKGPGSARGCREGQSIVEQLGVARRPVRDDHHLRRVGAPAVDQALVVPASASRRADLA